LMDGVKAGQSAILEISPVYYSTWDHSETPWDYPEWYFSCKSSAYQFSCDKKSKI